MSERRGVWIVLLLIGVAVAFSATAMLFVVFAAGAPPPVPSNASLYLTLRAPFGEVQWVEPFFVTPAPTVRATIDAIHRAAKDARIKTLVIKPETESALWAQLQEVRAALVDFRKSGKPITAYLESGGAQDYYLASAADRIVLMPAGQLDLVGLATVELFFRGALDKLGVYPDMLHIGDFKTASNTLTEKGFTAAHREMSKSLNHDWYEQLVRDVAQGRKRSEAEVRKIFDEGPYLADEAQKAGLVDALAYEDEVERQPPVQGTRRIDGDAYLKSVTPVASSTRIALLYAVGAIASGKSTSGGFDGGVVGAETFGEWVRKVRLDPTISAIVVRIDSPGGSAAASEVIWHELALAREIKPVIVSMGNVAASGGYYMAAPAHAIVAEPGTITGSIGVVTGKFAIGGALDKLGISTGTVSDGKLAGIYSAVTPFTSEERAKIEGQMRATYELFLTRVAEGRHSTPEKINAVGQGRVWTGQQAVAAGLVDALGGLDLAVQLAKERARIDVNRDVQLVVYPETRSVFDWLSNAAGTSTSASPSGLDVLLKRPDTRAAISMLSVLSRFRRGEMLTILPSVFWN